MYSEMRDVIKQLKMDIKEGHAEKANRTALRHYSATRMRPNPSRGLCRNGHIRIPLIGAEKRSVI